MKLLVDVPSGDKFGFPKQIPHEIDQHSMSEVLRWIDEQGYPVDWDNPLALFNNLRFYYKKVDDQHHIDVSLPQRQIVFRLNELENKVAFLMKKIDKISEKIS